MLIKTSPNRPIPELTPDRVSWLQNLQPGDLAHLCNGGYWDLYPLLVIVEADSSTVYTRVLEDFFTLKSELAMKGSLARNKDVNCPWSREDGTGVSEWRSHNFLLPPVEDAIAKCVAHDKAITIPDRYVPPNVNAINGMIWSLKNRKKR